MDLNQLQINTSRLRPSTGKSNLTDKQKIESDRGRVIFSSPLRRMQSKAQVFSLESNAAVRSRLTHSLEVAHIGRYIVQKLQDISKNNEVLNNIFTLSESIIETACHLHDIGNPPFGHLGEAAIKEWFTCESEKLFQMALKSNENDEIILIDKNCAQYKDFENFDGNPQGLRVVMSLQGEPGKKGLNLTYSQIASIIKYPVFSDNRIDFDKIGAYSSEREYLEEVWKGLSLKYGERYPLVYIMEAADDIAYSLGDIEDGIEKGIKSEKDVMRDLEELFDTLKLSKFKHFFSTDDNDILKSFISFRISMINELVNFAAKEFIRMMKEGDTSKKSIFYLSDDGKGDIHSKAIKNINKYCKSNFYLSSEAIDIEIAGYNIVHGLLEKFSVLLTLNRKDFKKLVNEKKGKDLVRRVFLKIPQKLIDHYNFDSKSASDTEEWYNRTRLIVDYISGMTDDFALKVYKLFNGIEVDIL